MLAMAAMMPLARSSAPTLCDNYLLGRGSAIPPGPFAGFVCTPRRIPDLRDT